MSSNIFKKPEEFMFSLKGILLEHINDKTADTEAKLLSGIGETFKTASNLILSSKFNFHFPVLPPYGQT